MKKEEDREIKEIIGTYYKCDCCDALLEPESLEQFDVAYECPKCGELYGEKQEAEDCCEDEEK